jgi:hypothetical protein
VCFMRICDYKFAVYGFFAEHSGSLRFGLLSESINSKPRETAASMVRSETVTLGRRSQVKIQRCGYIYPAPSVHCGSVRLRYGCMES